jgi:hypothetical protein
VFSIASPFAPGLHCIGGEIAIDADPTAMTAAPARLSVAGNCETLGGEATLNEIRTRFGVDVAQIVFDCTNSWVDPKPVWRPRKEAYLSLLPNKTRTSLLVALGKLIGRTLGHCDWLAEPWLAKQEW